MPLVLRLDPAQVFRPAALYVLLSFLAGLSDFGKLILRTEL